MKNISNGPVHKIPEDLRKALAFDKAALAKWEDITPLARNEWICWVTSAKQAKVRALQTLQSAQSADLKSLKQSILAKSFN